MQKIPENIIDDLYKVDLLSVAKDIHPGDWNQKGGQWWALSPFKTENTPSFTVHNRKGFYKCHATGKGGRGAIKLVQDVKKLNFPDACRWVAKFAGITIPAATEEDAAKDKKIQAEKAKVKKAAAYYAESKSEKLSEFIAERGINVETSKLFQIGYAPENDFSKFKGRIIFPICDQFGNPIAFGGRSLSDNKEEAKYINSTESDLYDKSKTLYAWDLARESASNAGYALLTEGYMDTIMCHQHGFTMTVASCGTALTPYQAKSLAYVVDEVVILRDGDPAGQQATLRDIKVLLAAGIHPRAFTLPNGQDPDDYLQKEGKDALQKHISHAKSWISFLQGYYITNHGQIDEDTGEIIVPIKKRTELMKMVVEYIQTIPDQITQQEYAKEASTILGIDMKIMAKELGFQLIKANSVAIARNGFRRTWQDYQNICELFGLTTNDDFSKNDAGFMNIAYYQIGGKPFKIRRNRQSIEAVRKTNSYDPINAVYIHPCLRLENTEKDWGNLVPLPMAKEEVTYQKDGYPLPLYLVQDEITASILVDFGIPAIGMNNFIGFARNKGQKELHAQLDATVKHYNFKHIVYVLPGAAWSLPEAKDADLSSVGMKFSKALISFNVTLKDLEISSYCMSQKLGHGPMDEDLWIEDIIQKIRAEGKEPKDEFLKHFKGQESPYVDITNISYSRPEKLQQFLKVENAQDFFDYYADQLGAEFRFNGKLYEVDIKSGAVSLKKGQQDPDVKSENGAYYSRQRNGGWKEISNFTLECLLEVKAQESFNLYRIKSRDTGVSQITIIPDREFTDRTKFISCIRRQRGLKAWFKGTTQDCLEIQATSIQYAPEAEPLEHTLGWYKPYRYQGAKQGFYVMGNGLINEEGNFIPVDEQGLVNYDGETYFLPAHSNIRTADNHKSKYEREINFSYSPSDINFKDWLYHFRLTHGENADTAFFFFLMALYRDIILETYDERIPHLFLLGPKNAGKGTLQESLCAPFGKLKVLGLNEGPTSSSYRYHFAQYRNAFAVFNECNPSSIPGWMVTGFKGAYDNQTRARMKGPNTKEIDYGEVNSAVLIMGQEPTIYQQEAISTRCIVLHCNKEKYTADESKRWDELKSKHKAGLGHYLGDFMRLRPIIKEHFSDTATYLHKALKEEIDRLFGTGASYSIDGRLFYNWSVALSPVWILTTKGKLSYPLSNKDILEFAARQIKNQAEQMISKGVLEMFWDFLSAYYWDRSYEIYDHLVWHDKKKGHLNIKITGLYIKFEQYIKKVAPNIENVTRTDLTRRFKSHPAFIGYRKSGIWFGYRKDTQGNYVRKTQAVLSPSGDKITVPGEGIRNSLTSGYIFDASKLNLELRQPVFPWDDVNGLEPDAAMAPAPSSPTPDINGSIVSHTEEAVPF
jgi:DNA primase